MSIESVKLFFQYNLLWLVYVSFGIMLSGLISDKIWVHILCALFGFALLRFVILSNLLV